MPPPLCRARPTCFPPASVHDRPPVRQRILRVLCNSSLSQRVGYIGLLSTIAVMLAMQCGSVSNGLRARRSATRVTERSSEAEIIVRLLRFQYSSCHAVVANDVDTIGYRWQSQCRVLRECLANEGLVD
jgi:hypothetical protein